MGLFNLLFGKSDNNDDLFNNQLENEKQSFIAEAKNYYYQQCFSELTENIPWYYKNNKRECFVIVRSNSTVELDTDTIHKVLTKASYDAIKSVGLKNSNKPHIEKDRSSNVWNIWIRW